MATKPSDVERKVGWFDRFARATSRAVSRAPFFALAVALVVLWLAEGAFLVARNGWGAFLAQSYQIQINTATTIITFLLVALLQNTQSRDSLAIQDKLNALSEALGDLLGDPDEGSLREDVNELRAAVGIEDVISSSDE